MISFVLFPQASQPSMNFNINIGIGRKLLFLNTEPSHRLFRGHMKSDLFPAESL